MNNELVIFSNPQFGDIRTAGTSEQPLFCLADVCKALGLENSRQVKQRLDDGVISNDIILDSLGRKQQAVFINEDGLYDVILDSRKPEAKAFRKWITSEVLPSIRKTGSYNVKDKSSDYITAGTIYVEAAKKLLNLSDSSVASLLNKIAEPFGLPQIDYVKSKGVVKSATQLLKENNINLSAMALNTILESQGYVERKTRQGSHGKIHKWYVITDKGLKYGENQVSPNNKHQTQALWYEDKFMELYSLINKQ